MSGGRRLSQAEVRTAVLECVGSAAACLTTYLVVIDHLSHLYFPSRAVRMSGPWAKERR